MNFTTYQKQSRSTALYPRPSIGNFIYPVMGLAGEAGEVADKVKKILRDDNQIITDTKREEIKQELGDVLWYVAQVATEFNLSLDDIAASNLTKLQSRLKRGQINGSGDSR